jgi:hypothetical protein
MRVSYVKSMVGASMSALLFSGFAFEIVAGEQDSKSKQPKSEYASDPSQKGIDTSKAEVQSSQSSEEPTLRATPIEDIHPKTPMSAGKISTQKSNFSQNTLQAPNSNAAALTLTSSETRVLRRLEKLNSLDADNAHDNSEEETSSEYPDVGGAPLPQSDRMYSSSKSETPLTSGNQDSYREKPSYASTLSTPATAHSSSEEPKIVVTPSAWDNGDERKEHKDQKEEKADSPTSEGQGPEGKHKMGKFAPSGSIIPIIRMGENSQDAGGFTIINNPWNS